MCKAKKMCKPGMFWIDFFGPSTFLIIFSLKSMEVKLGRKCDSIWFIFGLEKLNCKNILIWMASRQSKYENIWDSPSPPIDCRVAGRGRWQPQIHTDSDIYHKYTVILIHCNTNTLQHIEIYFNIAQIHCDLISLQHKYTATQTYSDIAQMHFNLQ